MEFEGSGDASAVKSTVGCPEDPGWVPAPTWRLPTICGLVSGESTASFHLYSTAQKGCTDMHTSRNIHTQRK